MDLDDSDWRLEEDLEGELLKLPISSSPSLPPEESLDDELLKLLLSSTGLLFAGDVGFDRALEVDLDDELRKPSLSSTCRLLSVDVSAA